MGILLKNILLEAKMYSMSTEEVLEQLLKFDGKTLIFMDTETSGLDVGKFYTQPIQISALVVDGSTWEIKEEYSADIKLRNEVDGIVNYPASEYADKFRKEQRRWMAKYKKELFHPKTSMDKAGYNVDSSKDEKDVMLEFQKLVEKYPNPIIVSHNAKFDMNIIQSSRRYRGLSPLKDVLVLDTLQLTRYFYIPLLVAMESSPEIAEILKQLLAKTKYKSYGSSLGKLAGVFKVKSDKWHDSRADVQMLFEILKKMIDFLEKNKSVDARKYRGVQAKRFRNSW